MHRWMRRLGTLGLLGCLLAGAASTARAEDYVLGNEDVISVSVWLHPELAATLTINADGNVTLPPVGDIHATGLTSKQLGERMADRLSAYLRQTTTVTVNVTQFVSHSVLVTGGVNRPGRYGYERIPSLVEVLGAAGGAVAGADLSQVQVVRKEGDNRRSMNADVALAMRTGDAGGLPELKPGDTVIVPAPVAPGTATIDGIAVLGEVNRPGFYNAPSNPDVWGALAACGGLSPRGNLADVRVLTRGEGGMTVARLDLRAQLEHGSRAPATLKPGDVVVVMQRSGSLWNGFVSAMALSQNALNTVVLVDYLRHRGTTP